MVVGGVQNRAARAKAFNERRFVIMEEIADLFPRYIAAWRWLVQISELEWTRAQNEAAAERKMAFISQRDEARDALCSALSRGQIYLSEAGWLNAASMRRDSRVSDLAQPAHGRSVRREATLIVDNLKERQRVKELLLW